MTLSLFAASLWFVLAAVLASIPSNDQHWRRAYFLIAIGIPIVGLVAYQNGPWIALIILGAGCSFLRGPVYYLWQWFKRNVTRRT